MTTREQRERIKRVKIKKRKLKFLTCCRGDRTRALKTPDIKRSVSPLKFGWFAEYVVEAKPFCRVTVNWPSPNFMFVRVAAALNAHPRLSVRINMTTKPPQIEVTPKQ